MLNILMSLFPYPHVDDKGNFSDGMTLPQPSICQKCKDRDCLTLIDLDTNPELYHAECSKGMSIVLCKFPVGLILCNGLIVKMLNSKCSPFIRKKYQSHKVDWDDITAWHKGISNVIPVIEESTEKKAQETIHGLHDVKTAVSLVTRNAEAIVATLPGDSDEEKIEGAPNELKALLKSVELLHSRLSASSILANPEAASHGQKRPTPVHKICFRLVRLFQELAIKRRLKIKMIGDSYAKPNCYDSFSTIPLILIDNAVKYSDENQEIVVTVKDREQCVFLEVASRGPLVPADMRQAIFERGIRGPNSSRIASQGSGLGLYIAGVVAKAHGFDIEYHCSSNRMDDTSGLNMFRCNIPTK